MSVEDLLHQDMLICINSSAFILGLMGLTNDMPQLLLRIAGDKSAMPPLLNKTTDQRIVHHGTWEQFKFIQKGFEASLGVRLFYYDGAIEILSPGREHEIFASIIRRMINNVLAKILVSSLAEELQGLHCPSYPDWGVRWKKST